MPYQTTPLANLMPGTDYQNALELALRKLRSRDRFEKEVRVFLSEFTPDTVDRVIEFLKDRRIIDDTKTTQTLIERHTGKRLVGIERLRAELMERGAPEETIDAVLGASNSDERLKMLEALSAKFTPADSRVKAARFLFSRGFPDEEIESVLDRFFGT